MRRGLLQWTQLSPETPPPIPRSQILAGAALALLAAALGLWLTWDRLEPRAGWEPWLRPDRRLAESGRVARPDSTLPGLEPAPESRRVYIPHARTRPNPAGSLPAPAGSPARQPAAPAPREPAPPPEPPPSPRPETSAQKAPSAPTLPQKKPATSRPRPAPKPPRGAPSEPREPLRPDMPLPVAWAQATDSWGLLSDWRGRPAGTLTALPGGLAVAPLQVLETMPPDQLHSPFGPLDFVAAEPELGLALLRADGARALPPAGVPARAGTELAAAPGFGSPGFFQPCVVTERLPEGLFLFRGNAPPTAAGGPLINRRRELAGVVLGSHPGYPGHDYVLAVEPWKLNELAQADPERPTRGNPALLEVARLLLRDVSPVPMEPQSRPGNRILPGTALGRFRLGNSREEVLKALGAGQSQLFEDGFEQLSYPVYRLEFTLLQQRVVSIATTDPYFGTSTGLGVGTSWEHARPGRELAGTIPGPVPGGGQRAVAPGLEVEIGPDGKVQRMRVTPR